jgi:hypothetical protein
LPTMLNGSPGPITKKYSCLLFHSFHVAFHFHYCISIEHFTIRRQLELALARGGSSWLFHFGSPFILLFRCLHIAFNSNSCVIAFLLTTSWSVDNCNWHWHRHWYWLEVELRQTAHLKTVPNRISKEYTILSVTFCAWVYAICFSAS